MIATASAALLLMTAPAATPAELSRLLPPEHNAIVVLNATAIRQAADGRVRAMRDVPRWVGLYVAGVDLLLAGPVERSRAAVIQLAPNRSLRDEGLIPDGFRRIGGLPASTDARGATLMELAPGLAGVLRPSDEQQAADWADSLTRSRLGAASPFLREAVRTDAGLLMAVNLDKAFAAEALQAFVAADPNLRDRGLTEAAVGMTGLSLAMRTGDILAVGPGRTAPATVRIGFATQPAAEPDAIRDLVASVLAELHLAMPALEQASVERDGSDVVATLRIGAEELEQLASLAMPPGYQPLTPEQLAQQQPNGQPDEAANPQPGSNPIDPQPLPPQMPNAPPADPQVVAKQTRKYFAALTGILDRFEKAAEASKPENRTAAWIGRYTKEITRLDPTNVDRRVLAYAREAEDAMRRLTASLQGQRVAYQTAEKQLVYRYDTEPVYAPYSYGLFGPFGYASPVVGYGGLGYGGLGYGGVRVGNVGGTGPRVGIGAGPIGPGGVSVPSRTFGGGIGPTPFGPAGVANPIGVGPGVVAPLPPVAQVGSQRRVLDSNIKTVRREQAQAIRKGAEERLRIWTELRTQENDLAEAMRETYGSAWTIE